MLIRSVNLALNALLSGRRSRPKKRLGSKQFAKHIIESNSKIEKTREADPRFDNAILFDAAIHILQTISESSYRIDPEIKAKNKIFPGLISENS